jgi:tRNA A-37 threonylcarbamoyl transferase component Bud32
MESLPNSPSDRIRQLWSHEDTVEYQRSGLVGKCLPLVSTLDVGALPWETAPPFAVADEAEILCVKRTKTRCVLTFKVAGTGGEMVHLYAKRFHPRRRPKNLLSWARASKTRREWDLGWGLIDKGLPTAMPLLHADRRRHGLLVECFLVTLGVENSISFGSLWRSLPDRDHRMRWLSLLGAFIRQSHAKGFAHDDLSSEHILVSLPSGTSGSNASFHFIDLDSSTLTEGQVSPYRRAHNFFQIFRSLPQNLLGKDERRAFYSGYSGGAWGDEEAESFDRAIRTIETQKAIGKMFQLKRWLKRDKGREH